jgi:hypothetical protein
MRALVIALPAALLLSGCTVGTPDPREPALGHPITDDGPPAGSSLR